MPEEINRDKENAMNITYQIDPLLPPFTNGAVFYTPKRIPSTKNGATSISQDFSPLEVLFLGTTVSPQWDQESELVLQRLMVCQGITTQQCAAWVCEQEPWLFDTSLIDYRSQERVQRGLPPLHHIPEDEAFSLLAHIINLALRHMAQEIITREKEAAACLFSPQILGGKRRLLSLLETTKNWLEQRGENHHQV